MAHASAAIASSSRVAGEKNIYLVVTYMLPLATVKQLYFMVLQVNHCPLVTDVCVS